MKKFTAFAVEQFTGKIKRACVIATDLRHAFVPGADTASRSENFSTAGFTPDELADLSNAVGNLIQDRNDYCRFEEGTEELIKRLETLQDKITRLSRGH